MAIGMRLYLVPDPDLGAFSVAPLTLKVWFRSPRPRPDVMLHEAWQDLGRVLYEAGAPFSPFSPEDADYHYPDAAEHGAHALSSVSTERLLAVLEPVDRALVDRALRRHARGAQGPEELEAATDAVMGYLDRLRASCRLAVEKGYGLLFAFWDEAPDGH